MTISYLDVLTKYYPGVHAHAHGSDYSELHWDEGGPIPQNELEAKMIDIAKEKKIEELSFACEQDIIGGFASSALGEPHMYDSEEVDQINLLGAIAAISPMNGVPDGFAIYYACRHISTGDKSYEEHTYMQLRGVLQDGSMFKLGKLQQFHMRRATVDACQSIAEIEAITW
jgi:hypothetical protein